MMMAGLMAFVFPLLFSMLIRNCDSMHNTEPECVDDEIRLFPDSGFNYLDYCVDGDWSRLCADGGLWDISQANVACRQLGYQGAAGREAGCTVSVEPENFFTFTRNCLPTENTVQQCGGAESTNCGSCGGGSGDMYGHIPTCTPACSDGDVRLVDGVPGRSGRVEVCTGGAWGTVCNNNQQDMQLVVAKICTTVRGTESVGQIITPDPGFVPIRSCELTNGILNCVQVTDTSCTHSMDLGLDCRTFEELQISVPTPPPVTCPTQEPVTCPTPEPVTCPTSEPVTCPECPSITTALTTCPEPTCPDCPYVPPCNITVISDPIRNTTCNCDNLSNSTVNDFLCIGGTGSTVCIDKETLIIILGSACGALCALVFIILIGCICLCICLRRKSARKNSKNGLQKRAHNPVYDGVVKHDLKSSKEDKLALNPAYGEVVNPYLNNSNKDHNYEDTDIPEITHHLQPQRTSFELSNESRTTQCYENTEINETFESTYDNPLSPVTDAPQEIPTVRVSKFQEQGTSPQDNSYYANIFKQDGDSPQGHIYEQGNSPERASRQDMYNKLVHVPGSPELVPRQDMYNKLMHAPGSPNEKPQMMFVSPTEKYSKLEI